MGYVMCGIAGILTKGGVLYDDLKRMSDSIKHRGPDGEGLWINGNTTAGLAHRRLSIIDLSDAGSQPMFSLDKRYTIIFNGEIYNYLELRDTLIKEGFFFHSDSDTEVLLNLYIQKGANCLNELDGMFAFAIWDEKEQKLFCARDRFGEKPFYFHFVPGKIFLFASELKAIHAYGIHLNFHPHRIGWYLNDKYALSNPLKQDETFYKEIFKLESGYSLTINKDLQLRKDKYWDINIHQIDYSISLPEAEEQFKYLFRQSVQRRLRSDVPIGTSLSGGLDSSSVVCIIAELLKEKGGSQKTFSARFKNYDKDEGGYIEEVLKGRSIDAFYTWPEVEDFLPEFSEFIYHQEEPVGSANQFSQWEVMKLARRNNVTVLLDGQGADEVITGYSHYFDTFFAELSQHYPERLKEEVSAYINHFNPDYIFNGNRAKRKIHLKSRTKSLVYPIYEKAIKPFLSERRNLTGLLDPDYNALSLREGKYHYFDYQEGLNKCLYHDAKYGKMEVLLRYGDKNSMAHSREVRLPFLNHQLVEFVFSLPPWFKIHKGWSKYILRESLKDVLPSKIAWRKDKIGYETPQERWMKAKGFEDILNDSIVTLERAGMLNRSRNSNEIKGREWQIINVAGLINTFNI
jgi:asparagine synthase (glutamine-hydrolysing)